MDKKAIINKNTVKSKIKIVAAYSSSVTLSLLILIWVMKLWNADLSIPFTSGGDATFGAMLIKGIIDNGWYLHNSYLGAPAGLDMYDFPMAECFHLLLIKVISFFTTDYATSMNIYFLLTFPLTTITSLFALRQFNVSYKTAIVGSILFAFLPYHFMRGESQLFLASYYMVPLIVMVILWVYEGNGLFYSNEIFSLTNRKTIASIGICLIVASTGIYYAFFACYFLLAAGIFAFLKQKKVRHIIAGGLLIAVIALGVFINIAPSIAYEFKYGENTSVANRKPIEAEMYGLKISQLILPVSGHRISYLADLRVEYNNNSALNKEYGVTSLCIIGSFGFLLLIMELFYNISKKKIFTDLSKLNILAVLLGTIGGFSSLFALIISPNIRAYNRISVYIAFFSIFAVMLFLENLSYKYFETKKANTLYCSVLGLILVFGIFDQTTSSFAPNYSSLKAEYINDKDFVAKIEASIPGDSMIFQLPYVPFPENPQVNKMCDYELFRGYLQSKNLRWSYGTMKGRECDNWQKGVAAKPLNEFMESIALAGFNGIYLDRNGYADLGADIEAKLTRLLDLEPLVSTDNRLVFFNISDYNNKLKEYYGDKWELKRELALNPLLLTWLGGFSDLEGKPEGNWRWCSSEGELHINNTSQNERKVELEMLFATGYEDVSNLFINSTLFSEQLNINSKSKLYSKTVIVPPGKHVIKFECDAKRVNAPKDTRVLVFKVVNFNIKSLET